ncbi:MAG: hypothetical protein Q4P31_06500 [Andreesenia angusta]|nr:hypothetical protein [Andreesenia angusta]
MDGEDKSTFYLQGSEKRLRYGALIANFTIPLMIFSAFSIYIILDKTNLAILTSIILAIGFSLSPLAHCSFYYVGSLYNTIYKSFKEDKYLDDFKELALSYRDVQTITWLTSIIISFSGWLLYTILVFSGNSILPWYFGFINPIFLSILAGILPYIPYPGKPLLNGAMFNIASIIFYTILLIRFII